MSNKKKREKAAASQAESKKRKQLIAELNSRQYNYTRYVVVSDKNNGLWGDFTHIDKVRVHIATCYCGASAEKGEGKVYMTVRANPHDSCALSMHMYSNNLEDVVSKFDEYKALTEGMPETIDWNWCIEHGFKYYQV